MQSIKPSVLEDIGHTFEVSAKHNHTSIFVLDWMVTQSEWKMSNANIWRWRTFVVLDWFGEGNSKGAAAFIERADSFLCKCPWFLQKIYPLNDDLDNGSGSKHKRSDDGEAAGAASAKVRALSEIPSSEPPPLYHVLLSKQYLWGLVLDFRRVMLKNITRFMHPLPDESTNLPRHFTACDMLLCAFMREKFALCRDDQVSANLLAWTAWCEDPEVDFINDFNELMIFLKPSVLNDIGHTFDSNKPRYTSIYVLH